MESRRARSPVAWAIPHVDDLWNGGFTATVTNTGSSPLTGRSTDWSFTGDERVVNAWNARVTQSGQAVHAVNAGYNDSIPAQGSTSFGFQGSGSAVGAPSLNCTAS